MADNLAAQLCLLLEQSNISAIQWKLLGQEKDGSILLGWVEEILSNNELKSYSVIGRYDRLNNKLEILHKFPEIINLIQATINQSHSILGYITKKNSEKTKDSSQETLKVIDNEVKKIDEISEKCLQETVKVDDKEIKENEETFKLDNQETKEILEKISQTTSNVDCDNKVKNNEETISNSEVYQAFLLEFTREERKIHCLETEKSKQIRIQFLYREKDQRTMEKFLLLVHQEYIRMYNIAIDVSESEEQLIKELKSEILVKNFLWAQWDSTNQVLYHIHERKPAVSLFTDMSPGVLPKPSNSSPTLSGFQFHDDLPHETVLNIPLNLPQLPDANNCGTYEDDVIPLRIHDCSLDLIVISDSKGMVCVCHHYLYRPIKPPQHVLNSALSDSNTVHFAYSITLLHHSCVIHCVIPGIPWSRAKLMRPTFALYGNHHMIVFVQNSFTHLLEIGLHHQPCCHILCGPLPSVPTESSYLVPLLNIHDGNKENNSLTKCSSNILTIDLPTLNLVTLTIPIKFLIETYSNEKSIDVRLAILHYFFCHRNDLDIVGELISIAAEKPRSLDLVKIFQEFLISGSNALVQKNLLLDTMPLLALLPITTLDECSELDAKINDLNVSLTHEKLWNTSVMLLSPQQRLVPYRSDLWTKLWDQLSKRNGDLPRFKPSKVAEKLLMSLACYQPEALSRSSTPMSPSGGLPVTSATLGELMGSRSHKYFESNLPFIEMESCTASKQEHIVAVNLRELSMFLLKHGTQSSTKNFQGSCTPLHVHAMSSKHVSAQLETSRLLCQMLCKTANVDSRLEQERGFSLVDKLDEARRWWLFTLLERYKYATESIAFPVPQGFTSFFTYLGYRTLKYSMFLQYVKHSAFELQVDVAKIIMADVSDSKENIPRKLQLLSLLPRSRAKRLLNQWLHPISLMLRAREHATNILSGEICPNRSRQQHRHPHSGISAFPSANRLSPLDTFLDLLTAKASLTELDFGLLNEATVTSIEDFI
ncbi:protein pigeon [Leptopilina boulardi]|uniref:protein pigeon n=1 Tax=Leptopilina boulardi TaxID=63433 RepID=UPI0021F6568D|nr:protein pigeon [Leptopilina boulardi]